MEICISYQERYTMQFKRLDDKGKFIYMLSAGVDVAELVAKFSYDHVPLIV